VIEIGQLISVAIDQSNDKSVGDGKREKIERLLRIEKMEGKTNWRKELND
jgi:hypothetical protein